MYWRLPPRTTFVLGFLKDFWKVSCDLYPFLLNIAKSGWVLNLIHRRLRRPFSILPTYFVSIFRCIHPPPVNKPVSSWTFFWPYNPNQWSYKIFLHISTLKTLPKSHTPIIRCTFYTYKWFWWTLRVKRSPRVNRREGSKEWRTGYLRC